MSRASHQRVARRRGQLKRFVSKEHVEYGVPSSPSGNSSLIDLAMVANTEYLKQCTPIPPLSTSDHLGLSITLQWKVHRAPPRKSRKVWFYKHGDFEKTCRLIEHLDWNSILTENDIDAVAKNWTDSFLFIMEQCIPHRCLRMRCNLPWLTKNIFQLIRKRNTFSRRAKSSGRPMHFLQYKIVRNKIVYLLRNGKRQYFNNLATASDKCSGNLLGCSIKTRNLSHLSTQMAQ